MGAYSKKHQLKTWTFSVGLYVRIDNGVESRLWSDTHVEKHSWWFKFNSLSYEGDIHRSNRYISENEGDKRNLAHQQWPGLIFLKMFRAHIYACYLFEKISFWLNNCQQQSMKGFWMFPWNHKALLLTSHFSFRRSNGSSDSSSCSCNDNHPGSGWSRMSTRVFVVAAVPL